MSFSPQVINELHAELAGLDREKRNLDERLAALTQRSSAIRLVLDGAPAPTATSAFTVVRLPPELKGDVGFRPALLTAMKRQPGARPIEISASLESAGVVVGGKTPLKIRVQNELFRMFRQGSATRTKSGGYVLVSESDQKNEAAGE
jgi:hypothetical protein